MYALIESGGQQLKVEPGRYVTVRRLAVEEGAPVTFERVLLVRDDDRIEVGAPVVDGAAVSGTVKRHLRGPKIHGFRYNPKKGSSRRWGARADLTQVTIDAITVGGQTFGATTASVEDDSVTDETVEDGGEA
jgi:large subunit ribosomal protein L21